MSVLTEFGRLRLREEIVLRRFDVYREKDLTLAETNEYTRLETWPERRDFRARCAVKDAMADADIIIAALYPEEKRP